MPDSFRFTTAAALPLAAIVRAINLVYPHDGDTLEGYVAYAATTQIDFAQSVVALDDAGEVAGLAMLGVRGERGWCGDAAVIPQYQNQKLGQKLMRRLSDSARAIGLRTLQLEVRDDNAPARRVYEKEGYTYTRCMPCYAATSDALGWRVAPLPQGLSIRRAPDPSTSLHPVPAHSAERGATALHRTWAGEATMAATLLRWYDPRSAQPCWERELPSLLSHRNQQAWMATRGGRDVAFLMGHPARDGTTLAVQHLALTADATPADARGLCMTAVRDTGVERLRIGLEPIDSRVAVMFREFGFAVDKDLWEMVKVL